MAINSVGQNLAVYGEVAKKDGVEDRTTMSNDDFMMLLLAEMQNQDPTDPMDSSTILTQTSQLASMSAADATNTALEDLATGLANQDQFSTISAIGKMADLGSDGIEYEKGSATKFEIYFPNDVKSGTIDVTDTKGNVVGTIPIEMPEDDDGVKADKLEAGVYVYEWDGTGADGTYADSGIYHVNSKYTDTNSEKQTTRLGAYPIESVRFEEGKAFVKLGSSYIPVESISEIY